MPYITRQLASQFRTLPPLPDVDLSGRAFIVTGANGGIGLEIARHLATHGASRLILGVRDIQSGEKAREAILENSKLQIDVWQVDLASFTSIKAFADRAASLDRLDGIAQNAGVLGWGPFKATEDGHEITIQVNVLSPILLTLLLVPILERTRYMPIGNGGFAPRVVFTGSTVAEISPTRGFDVSSPLTGLDDPARYTAADRYNESKLVLHAMVRELIALFPEFVITDVCPGFVNTTLFREGGPRQFMAALIGRRPEEGARNISMALMKLEKSTDHKYYSDCRPYTLQVSWLKTQAGLDFQKHLWRDSIKVFDKVAGGNLPERAHKAP